MDRPVINFALPLTEDMPKELAKTLLCIREDDKVWSLRLMAMAVVEFMGQIKHEHELWFMDEPMSNMFNAASAIINAADKNIRQRRGQRP